MRYAALLALAILPSAVVADSTTSCYPIGGQLICNTHDAPSLQPACARSESDIRTLHLLIDRLVSDEVRALQDARLRILEEASKMSAAELEAQAERTRAGTYSVHEDAIERATQWLGRAPSQMAIERWKSQRGFLQRVPPEPKP